MSPPVPRLEWRRIGLSLLVVVALGLASGCRVDADVDVAVRRNGSGTVAVTVRLDQDAAIRVPNLANQLRTDDLKAAGWTVSGPRPAPGGGLTLVARARFTRVADVGPLVDQLAGARGPLRATLERHHSFGRDRFTFAGTLDLSKGLDTFSDPAFRQRLGDQPLDQILAGQPSALVASSQVRFTLSLPGRVASEPRARDHQRVQWKATLGQPPVELRATSDQRSGATRVFSIVAVAAVTALVLTVMGALILRRT